MKKKLWMTLGPIIVAFAIFLFILFGPGALFGGVSGKTVNQSASSMEKKVIQGVALQKKALDEGNYVPFFGSSELSRTNNCTVAKESSNPSSNKRTEVFSTTSSVSVISSNIVSTSSRNAI